MKVKTIDQFVKNTLGYKQYLTYLGIRADEPKRIAKQREDIIIMDSQLREIDSLINLYEKQSRP